MSADPPVSSPSGKRKPSLWWTFIDYAILIALAVTTALVVGTRLTQEETLPVTKPYPALKQILRSTAPDS